MNVTLTSLAQMLAISEGAGGLFDFNATLPLMALQFVLLTTVLTFVYYKPVAKVLEERESLISGNLVTASERLLKADSLYQQYDEQLKEARKNAQTIISASEKEAKEIVTSEINQARNDAASLIIPQAVAAPAISVFIVSMPEGDLSEYPPVSNKTPFPIIETLNLADLLYSPTSK